MEHRVTVASLPPPVATAGESPHSVEPTYLAILPLGLPLHLHTSFRPSSFLTLMTATALVTCFPSNPSAHCDQSDLSTAHEVPSQEAVQPAEKHFYVDFADYLEENGTSLIGR